MTGQNQEPWRYELRVLVLGPSDPEPAAKEVGKAAATEVGKAAATELCEAAAREFCQVLKAALRGITPVVCAIQALTLADDAAAPRSGAAQDAARAIDEAEFVVFRATEAKLGEEGPLRRALVHALRADRMAFRIEPGATAAPVRILRVLQPHDVELDEAGTHAQSDVAFRFSPGIPRRAKKLSPGWAQLEVYNRDRRRVWKAGRPRRRYQRQLQKQAQRVDAALGQSDARKPIVEHLVPELALANAVSIEDRSRHRNASIGVFALSLLASGLVVFQSQHFPDQHWVFLAELALMGGALGLVALGRRWHERWILARYLTERLRSAKVWCVLGLPPGDPDPDPGAAAPAHPVAQARPGGPVEARLPFYSGPRGWVGSIVEALVAQVRGRCDSLDLEAARQHVLRDLLGYQVVWHRRNARRKRRPHFALRAVVVASFSLTLLVAILHIVLGHSEPPAAGSAPESVDALNRWLTSLAIFLPAVGGAAHAIDRGLELERVAARSEGMASVLDRYAEQVEQAQSLDELRAATTKGLRVIDLENDEWWALLSFAAPEIAV